MPQVSIARLFEDNREKLRLEWVAGRNGAEKELNSELTKDSSKGLIGHLNFIHPNLIQVVGASEAVYLRGLDAASCRSVLAQVATKELACFIIAGVDEMPEPLTAVAERVAGTRVRAGDVPVERHRDVADHLRHAGLLSDVPLPPFSTTEPDVIRSGAGR